jgi:hypothetical protein
MESIDNDVKKLKLQIGIKNKGCVVCGIESNFAPPGAITPLYCHKHKTPDCVDVKHKSCTYPGCSKRKTFGFIGSKPERCSSHIEEGMVDLNNKKCLECGNRPYFGLPGTNSATHCSLHKKAEMIDIVHKRCELCSVTPSYGYKAGKPTHCSAHRLPDMIDVKHDICNSCSTYASFGIPGRKPTHCTTHKQAGQIFNPKKTCQVTRCKKLALFGYTTPNHCEEHKAPDEADLIQRECSKCGLPDIVDANGSCPMCDPALYNRIRLAKQKKVRDFFNFNHMKYISYDQMIDRGICGKKRPDFVFDCGTHMIVVEVDENQHEGYTCECEQVRMINITQSLGMRTVFIRFNPDKYKPAKGRADNREYKRLENLKTQIEYFHQNILPVDGACFVTYLYYDEDDPQHWCNLTKLH